MNKITETIVEIDLAALAHNFHVIKSKLHSETKLLGVVKASAYGSDIVCIAKKLAELHIDYLAVAYVGEGVELRDAGITVPIMVLHPQEESFGMIFKNNLEPVLYSKRIFELFLRAARENNLKNYPVHLKFNTGLNRLGFIYNDLPYLIENLPANSNFEIISLFSHLAASDDRNEKTFSNSQIACFVKITHKLLSVLENPPMLHILNTSGIFNFPEAQYDMVRSGIGLYGFANDDQFTKQLKNVINLKTIISQINTVSKGTSVGYNRSFIADKPYRIATLPLGHVDGISRNMGNGRVFVKVNGEEAPIVGNVCMDMIMIDVSNIHCEEGDEVVIFDNQEMVNKMAIASNTISYEILTNLSKRMKRVVK